MLSIGIASIAIAGSAFTTIKSETSNKLIKVYFQQPNGRYISNPEVGLCITSTALHPCTLYYPSSTPGDENFIYTQRPSGAVMESERGYYEAL